MKFPAIGWRGRGDVGDWLFVCDWCARFREWFSLGN